jgi:hypothetical protein
VNAPGNRVRRFHSSFCKPQKNQMTNIQKPAALAALGAAVLLLPSCVVAPAPGPYYHHHPYVAVPAPAIVAPGIYVGLPPGFAGEYYFYGGRYYYGGRWEPGRFWYGGRWHNGRYWHNGHYYYGGRYGRR